jgi:hypothetical protein
MPVEQKGFLFRYFDKALCVVAAVGLLVALLLAVRRSGTTEAGRLEQGFNEARDKLDRLERAEPPPAAISDYESKLTAQMAVSPSPVVYRDPFDYRWPIELGTRRLGTSQEYDLRFPVPLRQGLRVVSEGPGGTPAVVEIVRHPANGVDHRVTRVRTFDREGTARIEGKYTDRDVYLTVAVDKGVDAQAEPPLNVRGKATRAGVVITFDPNPKNVEHEIVVQSFGVLRRELGPIRWPYDSLGAVAWVQDQKSYTFTDTTVVPAKVYAYVVQTIAPRALPPQSPPSEPVELTALSDVDFKLTGGQPNAVQSDVVIRRDGRNYKHKFNNAYGEEIGGVVPAGESAVPFLTGCALLDYHPHVLRTYVKFEREFREVRSRIIYVDPQGNVRIRWKDEVGHEDMWTGTLAVPAGGFEPVKPPPGAPPGGPTPYERPGAPPPGGEEGPAKPPSESGYRGPYREVSPD